MSPPLSSCSTRRRSSSSCTWSPAAFRLRPSNASPPWKVLAAGYSGFEWGYLALFAVVSVLLPFSLYFAGLRYLEPTRAIVASCLEPVFSIIIAAFVLSETVRPLQSVGIVIVLAAIVLVQLPERGEARHGRGRPPH